MTTIHLNSDSDELQSSEANTPRDAGNNASSSTGVVALPMSTPISFTDKEALLKFANCSSCSTLLKAPVLLCGGGHSVCSKCRSKFQKCPVCSNGFTDIRNLIVEAFLDKFASKCPFSKEGCNKVLAAKDFTPHQASCTFRHVECTLKGTKSCSNTSITYSKYFKHLKNVHGITGVIGETINLLQTCEKFEADLLAAVPWEQWPLNYLEVHDKIFFTGTEIREGNIFWWVSIIGTPREAQSFNARILISNEAASTDLSWRGPVFSFRWKPDQIIKEGCLTATQNNFRLLTQERKVQDHLQLQSFWNITFSISKKEPNSTKPATVECTATSDSEQNGNT